MKKLLLITGFLLVSNFVFTQDIELYHRYLDDRLEIPILPSDMSFSEFQILSRDITLMDMTAGIFFPGYISMKAQEKIPGYIALGIRSIGYAGVMYELYRYNELNTAELYANDFDRNIWYATIGILVTSYIFDWLYGKTALVQKQERIRYKYSMNQREE